MRCPYCGTNRDLVIDSRSIRDGCEIRRRRACQECGRRYTTYERIDARFRVVKKSGRRVPFSRDNVMEGLLKACRKRPIEKKRLDTLCDEIEREVAAQGDGAVTTRAIGLSLLARLKKLDEVAYLRFASVFREFKDTREFLDELKPLLGRKGPRAP